MHEPLLLQPSGCLQMVGHGLNSLPLTEPLRSPAIERDQVRHPPQVLGDLIVGGSRLSQKAPRLAAGPLGRLTEEERRLMAALGPVLTGSFTGCLSAASGNDSNLHPSSREAHTRQSCYRPGLRSPGSSYLHQYLEHLARAPVGFGELPVGQQ